MNTTHTNGSPPPRIGKSGPLTGLIVSAGLASSFIWICGMPYVRVSSDYRSFGGDRIYVSATYRTIGGSFSASPFDLGLSTCPLIILRSPKMPLKQSGESMFGRLQQIPLPEDHAN